MASGGAGPCPLNAHAHPGARLSGSSEANSRAQMRVSTKPDSSSLWLVQPGQRGPCRPGSQAPSDRGGRGEREHGSKTGTGWAPGRPKGRARGWWSGCAMEEERGQLRALPSGRHHWRRRVPACTCPCPAGPWDRCAGRPGSAGRSRWACRALPHSLAGASQAFHSLASVRLVLAHSQNGWLRTPGLQARDP